MRLCDVVRSIQLPSLASAMMLTPEQELQLFAYSAPAKKELFRPVCVRCGAPLQA